MLKQKHGLGYLWSEKACFFMSKQALTLQFILSKNSIEHPYLRYDFDKG